MQGVWQDDYTFADKPGKQLTKLSPVSYEAELDMVVGRETLLFGIRGINDPLTDWKRWVIEINGNTTGSSIVPLHFEFFLNGTRFYKDPIPQPIYLNGPCGEPLTFTASIDFLDIKGGVPYGNVGPFTIPEGPYILEAELVTEGGVRTGLKVTVTGEAVVVDAPEVHFVFLLLKNVDPVTRKAIQDIYGGAMKKIAADTEVGLPDLFPLPKDSVVTVLHPVQDLGDDIEKAEKDWTPWLSNIWNRSKISTRLREITLAKLNDYLKTGGLLAGADRVVAVLDQADYAKIAKSGSSEGFAPTTKVMFIHSGVDYLTVAHELVHTLPQHLWSQDQMEDECDLGYHWTKGRQANGFQLNQMSVPHLEEKNFTRPLMGSGISSTETWITQCTYWHLIEGLRNRVDPPLLLVRGRVARDGENVIGELFPAYQQDGVPDPVETMESEWAIVLKDERGSELGRYPFSPEWEFEIEDEGLTERDLVTFAHWVVAPEDLVTIDLDGPNGVLDSFTYSANPPVVGNITAGPSSEPQEDGVRVDTVSWSGSDADGDPLLYSVFYSTDDGETWTLQSLEQAGASLDVEIDLEAERHAIKIIATAGTQSGEGVINLAIGPPSTTGPSGSTPAPTAAPPAQSPAPTGGDCSAPSGGSSKRYAGPYLLLGLLGLLAGRKMWTTR